MDSVDYEPLGKMPSMYNPDFVRRVYQKRRAEADRLRAAREPMESLRKSEAKQNELRERRIAAKEIAGRFRAESKSLQKIVRRICGALRVSPADIFRHDQRTVPSLARQAVAYWMCRRTDMTPGQIGRLLKRDWTTIRTSRKAYVRKRKAMGRTLRPAR